MSLKLVSLATGTLGISLVYALPTDRNHPVQMAADYADLNQKQGVGIYRGHVILDQGTTHLRAYKAITKVDQSNHLTEALAFGNTRGQAHFWTQPAIHKPFLHAYANTITYYPNRHLIELRGQAQVKQGKNSYSAEIILYDTVKQKVISPSGTQKRVRIVFFNEKKHE